MTDQFSTEHCCGESLQFGTNEAIWSLWAAVGPSLASHPTCPNHPIKNVLTHMHRLEYNFSNQVKRLPKWLAGAGRPPDRRSTVFGGFMNTRFLARVKFACLAVILFAALSAHAQFRTSIQGTVTDPDGAVIPNAKLELKDNANNHVINATSDAGGVFNFNALPADQFTLTVTAAGFTQQQIQNLTVIPEQPNSVDVKLTLGESSTTITVSGETAAAMDTETANIGGTISSNDIQQMPSFNRDVFTLTQLVPGTISDGGQNQGGGVRSNPGTQGPGGTGNGGQFSTENGVQSNANGGQYETNGIQIDGISTVSAVWGGTTIITPNEDAIDNVRIVTNDYDAENGRFSGAETMVTSKSGTNHIHGTAFFAIHRPGLNAYNRAPFSLVNGVSTSLITSVRDGARFNQYGGSIGGPLIKDRLFAFF